MDQFNVSESIKHSHIQLKRDLDRYRYSVHIEPYYGWNDYIYYSSIVVGSFTIFTFVGGIWFPDYLFSLPILGNLTQIYFNFLSTKLASLAVLYNSINFSGIFTHFDNSNVPQPPLPPQNGDEESDNESDVGDNGLEGHAPDYDDENYDIPGGPAPEYNPNLNDGEGIVLMGAPVGVPQWIVDEAMLGL